MSFYACLLDKNGRPLPHVMLVGRLANGDVIAAYMVDVWGLQDEGQAANEPEEPTCVQ